MGAGVAELRSALVWAVTSAVTRAPQGLQRRGSSRHSYRECLAIPERAAGAWAELAVDVAVRKPRPPVGLVGRRIAGRARSEWRLRRGLGGREEHKADDEPGRQNRAHCVLPHRPVRDTAQFYNRLTGSGSRRGPTVPRPSAPALRPSARG